MDGFITAVRIDKVRHLENITIELSETEKKHLILTGKNGSGKTSVLEAMRQSLKVFERSDYQELMIFPQNIESYEKQIEKIENLDELTDEQKDIKITQCENMIKYWRSQISQYYKGLEIIYSNQQNIYKKYSNGDFVMAYFDAKRISSIIIPNSVEKVILEDKYSIDYSPSQIFVKYLVDLKTRQAFARNENDMSEVQKVENWFQNFLQALRNLFEDDKLKLEFDYKNYSFRILQQGREPFGFEVLSDGYSAFLNILMDLILRMEKKRTGAYDVEGIVLIDEIETHLHIDLQKKILLFLTAFFPKVQFIVTTHSPFVLNSVDNAVIYDLENKIKVEDLSAYSYEGIVQGYFNADLYSAEAKEKLDRYEELVKKKDKTEDEEDEMINLRLYLKKIPADLAKELVAKFRQIEIDRKGGAND